MSDEVRCAHCGARNGPDAAWCSQCYTTFASPPPTDDPPPQEGPARGQAPPPPDAEAPGLLPLPPTSPDDVGTDSGTTGALRSGAGKFRQAPDGLEWVCGTCGEWNPIERVSCTVCQSPFGSSLGASESPARPDVAPAVLTVASLLVPGAGHWLLGLRGPALLRVLLGLVWGLGGLTLLLRAQGSGQSVLPSVPLLLGWAVVAAGSANDAVVEGGGDGSVVLGGRTLLWLTLAVVGGTFATVLVGVLAAVGG